MRTKTRFRKFTAWLLTLAMLMTFIPGFTLTVSAADGTTWDGNAVATEFASGTGVETDPYIIETAAQLIYLRNQVNSGQSYDDQYFRLNADLDMASSSFGNSIGYINSSYEAYYFNGHFDGNNHTISNLTINSTSGYTALFGNVGYGTNESVISNLTLSGVDIARTAKNYGAAALIGQAKSVKIENCTIESGTVNCKSYYTAGFVANIASGGSGLTMTNCINKATITSTRTDSTPYTAGICGYANSGSNITGCINYGDVTSQKGFAGGISAYSNGAVIKKCANYGGITNGGSSASGILSSGSNYSITNCFNQGAVSASNTAGGITYYLNIDKTDKIENCYNVGTVSITSTPSSNKYSDSITTTSTRSKNTDRVINTYTLTDSGSGATTKTAYEFKSGAVASLLQGTQAETIWGQGSDYPEFYNGTNSIPEPPAAVTGIMLSADNLHLNTGDSATLTATVTPDDAGNKNVSWSSSAPSVATVENGVVTAIAEGNAVITATAEDGGFNATCTVTVQTHAHDWNAYEAKCRTCDATHFTHTDYEWANGVCSVCGVIGGYCGYVNQESSVEWILTSADSGSTYTLTISGTGNMGEYIDYNAGVDAPWFDYASQITTVVINDGVKDIGWGAFKHLVNLNSVSIPNSVTEIKRAAFLGASSLTSISLPSNVTTIGQSAFKESGLTSISIPSGVTKIQGSTFSGCTQLTSVTLPNSITEIEGNAFQQCSSLSQIILPTGLTTVGEWAFNQSGLTSVTIPSSVTSLGMHAFSGCPDLKTVTISGTNLTIAERAFQGDESLETLSINNTGNVTIGDYAFMIDVAEDDDDNVDIDSGEIEGWQPEEDGSTETDPVGLASSESAGNDTSESQTIERREDRLYSITLPANVTYATDYATSFKNRVRSISIGETATVVVDYIITLTPVFTPDTAYDKTITWTSNNENVATVDSDGKVTGVSAGNATITATAKYQLNGVCKSDSCTVTVRTHTHNWTYTLKEGTTDTIEATCGNADGYCPNATGGSVTISANNGTYDGTTEFKAAYTYSDDWNPSKGELTISYEYKATESGTYAATTELKNAGYYKASIKKTSSDNTDAVASVEYTIAKADATAPTGLTAVYGQTLANVSLPGGWTWVTPADSVGDVGTKPHKANYAGDENYNAASNVDVSVTINKAEPTVETPTNLIATYGDTLADVTLPIADNGKWSWKNEGTTSVGDAGTQNHKATFTPTDTTNYKIIEVDVPVEVTKATIDSVSFDVTAPEALADKQTSVENGTNYTAAIEWNTTDTEFGFNTDYTATVTLTADGNHKFADEISVDGWNKSAVDGVLTFVKTFDNTRKEKLTGYTAPSITNNTFTEYHANVYSAIAELPATVTYLTESGNVTIGTEWSCSSYNSTTKATNIFAWSVKDGELSNYDVNNIATSGSITVTNVDALPVNNTGNNTKITYDGNTYDVSKMFKKDANAGEATYAITGDGTGAGTLNGSTLTITKAGTIEITMTTATNGAYANGSATATLTVAKGTGEGSVTMNDWTYNETASEPNAQSATNGIENVSYLYKVKGALDGTYTDSKPTNAGNYTVKAIFAGTDLYNEVVKTADFTIEKATPSYEVPKNLNAAYGQTLADVSLPTGFKWQNEENTSVGNAGNNKFKVTYTPSDTNYNEVKDIEVTIAVAKATPAPNAEKVTTARVRRNKTLADATVTKGVFFAVDGTTVLEGTLAWVDDTKEITADSTEKMKFTPVDTNYAEIEIDVAVSTYSSSGGSSTTRYTVKFDTDGGNSITSQTVTKNSKATEPTEPTKDGYIFDGWYTDSTFEAEYDFDTKVTKNITLYAKWVEGEIQEPSNDNNDNEQEPTDEWKNPFTDITNADWFFENVRYANENGLMSGTTDTTFAPNDNLTRAMLVTVLYRAEGEPAVNKSIPFADVNASQYYANAVIWAEQNGIVKGVSETEFAPDENITREQIATIIYRYAEYKGIAPTGSWAIKLDYADVAEISDYAVEGVMYCTMKNIMQGKDNNMFAPKDNATRAEIAAILNRFIEGNK